MTVISWIVFGVLTGVAMQSIFGDKTRSGIVSEIASGVVGAILGGVSSLFLISERNASFTIFSYILSFIGAFVLLAFFNMTFSRPRNR